MSAAALSLGCKQTKQYHIVIRDGGLEDQLEPRDLILMASVSAAHVSVLVSELLARDGGLGLEACGET